MDNNQVMYQFQHKLLPSWFYEEPKQFVGVTGMEKTALFEIASELFRRAGVDNPYRAEHFSVEPGEVNKDIGLLIIKFPKPEKAPLCFRAFCFFDRDFRNVQYYTVEKGDDIESAFPILCTWTKEGEHFRSGSASPDPDEQLTECVEMFMGKYGEEIEKAYKGQEV